MALSSENLGHFLETLRECHLAPCSYADDLGETFESPGANRIGLVQKYKVIHAHIIIMLSMVVVCNLLSCRPFFRVLRASISET